MIYFPSPNWYPTIDVPRTEPYALPTGESDLPIKTDGHIATSIRQGLGNGYLLPNPPDGMSLPNDIRRAMHYLSRFDIAYGNNFAITFDPDFCKEIGGYPEGACLWYRHDGDHYDLVKSKIGDNTYNFLEHPEYIDGEKWDWAVPKSTNSSGYPYIKQNPIMPFGINITIGKSDGSSIISDVYQVKHDCFIYSIADIDFVYDESENIPSMINCKYYSNGRTNGVVPFSAIQVYVAVATEGPEAHGWSRDVSPSVIQFIPQTSIPSATEYIDGSIPEHNPSQGRNYSTFSKIVYLDTNESTRFVGRKDIKYYPLFTNSMSKRAVYVPARKDQYVFLAMSSDHRYDIKKLNIDLRLYDFASFDNGVDTNEENA